MEEIYSPEREMQSMQMLYLNSPKGWLDKHSSPTHSCNPSNQAGEYGIQNPHRGCPLAAWLLRLGSKAIGEIVTGRLPPPGHRTDSRLKQTSSLPVEKAYYVSQGFSMRLRLQVCHTPTDYGSAVRECKPGMPSSCSPLVLLLITSTS